MTEDLTAQKVSVFGVILARIFPHFPAFELFTQCLKNDNHHMRATKEFDFEKKALLNLKTYYHNAIE